MPFKVSIAAHAQKDIQQIIHYIKKDKSHAAENFKNLLIKKALSLKIFPLRGKKVPKHPNYRQLIVGSYHLIYRILQKEVRILRILHSKMESKETFYQ